VKSEKFVFFTLFSCVIGEKEVYLQSKQTITT
jgi:hypothetical protein